MLHWSSSVLLLAISFFLPSMSGSSVNAMVIRAVDDFTLVYQMVPHCYSHPENSKERDNLDDQVNELQDTLLACLTKLLAKVGETELRNLLHLQYFPSSQSTIWNMYIDIVVFKQLLLALKQKDPSRPRPPTVPRSGASSDELSRPTGSQRKRSYCVFRSRRSAKRARCPSSGSSSSSGSTTSEVSGST